RGCMSSTENGAAAGADVAGYEISTDQARLDIPAMFAYLTRSYWSPGIPLATVERAARNSLCFGLYEQATGQQVGLTRVVTDHATFAYLCDVYVLEEHRGLGLGKFMMGTRDAHGLYAQYGFRAPPDDRVLMQILRPGIYTRPG